MARNHTFCPISQSPCCLKKTPFRQKEQQQQNPTIGYEHLFQWMIMWVRKRAIKPGSYWWEIPGDSFCECFGVQECCGGGAWKWCKVHKPFAHIFLPFHSCASWQQMFTEHSSAFLPDSETQLWKRELCVGREVLLFLLLAFILLIPEMSFKISQITIWWNFFFLRKKNDCFLLNCGLALSYVPKITEIQANDES